MNKLIIYLCLLSFVYTTKAQYTLDPDLSTIKNVENNSGYIFYPTSNFINRDDDLLTSVVHNGINDTILIPISVGTITPSNSEEPNTDADTLTVDVAFDAFGNASHSDYATSIHHTKAASFTIYSKYNTYSFTDITPTGGASRIYKTYKFLENSVDTLMLVVTAGTYCFDKVRFDFSTNIIITDTENDLFGTSEHSAHFNNPVSEGILNITLPSSVSATTVQLVSMEGVIVDSKELHQGDSPWNLSHLKSGLYLLRDQKTGSTTKVIIQ